MNEKPQSLIIVINGLKLNETFWKKFWSYIIQRYNFVENLKTIELLSIIFEIMEIYYGTIRDIYVGTSCIQSHKKS